MAWVPVQEQLTENLSANVSAFETSYTPIPQTLLVYIDGVFQRQTIDYNIATTDLTFTTLIPSGQNVFAAYQYSNTEDETRLPNCDGYETVLPEGHRGSTTLNHAISSYDYLASRIKRQLGWPTVNIEMCDESIYDFIDQAVEWYSKYAGFTEEYLMFSSSLYECGKGVRLDKLFTQYSCWNCSCCDTTEAKQAASAQFIDCDMNSYRKVNGVFSVNPVEYTGTDTLFTLDYLFAQQTYFSYMLGSFGFDLITWHMLKDWLNLREKMFATMPIFRYDPRTQYLKLVPEPRGQGAYYGVVGCYVERPIKDLVKERWVQRYALALTMIALGHIRGKFGAVTLFGGGSINATDIMTQGLDMKKELEDEIMNKYGEVVPACFIMG